MFVWGNKPNSVIWYRFHLLRHTNASFRIEAVQNIKYIQNQLGHSSIQVTMDIYGHLMKPVNNEEAVKSRATLFSSKNQDDGSKMVAEEEKP